MYCLWLAQKNSDAQRHNRTFQPTPSKGHLVIDDGYDGSPQMHPDYKAPVEVMLVGQ